MSYLSAIDLINENKKTKDPFLDLGSYGLFELPDEVAELTHIEGISLGDYSVDGIPGHREKGLSIGGGHQNGISRISPHILTCLPRLKALYIGNNANSLRDYSFFRSLPQLEILDIPGSKVSDLDFLKYLKNLKSLNIAYNSQIIYYTPISVLSKLEFLNLSGNEVSNASFLKNLPALTKLIIDNNRLENLSFIFDLNNLESLSLGSTKNNINLNELKKHPNLKKLSFEFSKLRSVEFLNDFEHLEELDLTYAEISQAVNWSGTPQLKRLSIGNYKQRLIEITDWLTEFRGLEELTLRHCFKNFEFCQAYRSLKKITINNTDLEDITPFSELEQLEYADFSNNKIRFFPNSGFNKLKEINLINNNMAGNIEIKNCSELQTLKLFSEEIVSLTIENLPKLTSLIYRTEDTSYSSPANPYKLTSIQIKDKIIPLKKLIIYYTLLNNLSFIKNLPYLEEVKLYENRITGITCFNGLEFLKDLALENNNIFSLNGISGLPKLERLQLGYNKISDLGELSCIDNLKHLSLNNNNLVSINGIEHLKNLEYLLLDHNKIKDIEPLSNIKTIKRLGFSDNKVENIDSISSLSNLLSLSISRNEIKCLDPVQYLKKLRRFSGDETYAVSYNFVGYLTQLEDLDLCSNRLTNLSFLKNNPLLYRVRVSNNLLTQFPEELFDLPSLYSIDLSGNPIPNIPKELLIDKYWEYFPGVYSWFYEIRKGSRPNNELKLIIVGNARVGKSSVLDRMLELPFDPDKESTHAIRMERWTVDYMQEAININIWDFGGQDIYHGTHRLFLQSRALFLLVWDPETEKKSIQEELIEGEYHTFQNHPLNYWLDYIYLLSKGSPIIIVQNKTDKIEESSPYQKIISDKPYNIQAFRSVSAKTGDGIKNLKETIVNKFSEMEEFGREMPITWHETRYRIIEQASIHKEISYNSFEQIANHCGASRTARSLLDFLHHTGTVYYKEGLFNNRVILDQRWAIEAVYVLLDRKGKYAEFIRKGNGQFSFADLADVWHSYSKREKETILEFMESCELCFKWKSDYDNPGYIAPELLPEQPPVEVEIWPGIYGKTLYLTLNHQILHKALVQRFIVKVGNKAPHSTMWRTGLFLIYKGAFALIKTGGEYAIEVQVKGADENTKDLLHMIRNQLMDLSPSKDMINQCVSIDGIHFFDLKTLEKSYGKLPKILDVKEDFAEDIDNLMPFLRIDKNLAIYKNLDDQNQSSNNNKRATLKQIIAHDFVKGIDEIRNLKLYVRDSDEAILKLSQYNNLLEGVKYDKISYSEFDRLKSKLIWESFNFINDLPEEVFDGDSE